MLKVAAAGLTHGDKVFWPGEGITKGDLYQYYEQVAPFILPYMKDRPESLRRNPNGIADEGFFHKDAGGNAPEWVKTIELHSDSAGKDIDYILCNDKKTLLYLANLGCIEFNPWNSRVKTLEKPDYMVIDLDPSDDNTYDEVVDTALAVKALMDKAGATAFCKTSGATGLHVYVPFRARYDYEHVREFAHIVATFVAEQLPRTTTLERSLAKREKGKIYLDYLQNKQGQTLVAPYCVRPRAGAPVSTPLEWKEVRHGLQPSAFTLRNIMARLAKKGDLFEGVLGKGNDLQKCLKLFGSTPR
jgi:bifunctional non-homologous end joining protein LigD